MAYNKPRTLESARLKASRLALKMGKYVKTLEQVDEGLIPAAEAMDGLADIFLQLYKVMYYMKKDMGGVDKNMGKAIKASMMKMRAAGMITRGWEDMPD